MTKAPHVDQIPDIGDLPVDAKSETALAPVVDQIPDIGDLPSDIAGLLGSLGDLSPRELIAHAATSLNTAARLSLGAGVCLLQAKSRCAHGEFEACLREADVPSTRASELMAIARMVCDAKEADRERLIKQRKVVLLGLARMDDEVRQQWLETGELDEQLTLREYKAQVERLTADVERLQNVSKAQASKAEVELLEHIIAPDIPPQVSDLRRECAALYKQAELAVAGLADLAPMLIDTIVDAPKWRAPTALQTFAAMRSLHARLEVQMAAWRETFALDMEGLPPLADLAHYQPEEAVTVATHFAALAKTHLLEGEKRANRRANNTPGKRGAKRKAV